MNNPPKWLMPVAVVALLWNLIGVAALAMNAAADPAAFTPAQQALVDSTPLWAKIGSWFGVGAGALGSLGLVLRRGWAAEVLLISLAGVIIQDVWMFVLADVAAVYGYAPLIMQGIVLVIAIALVSLARGARAKGWLS
ncbi:MAG: hypothetical protein K2X31_00660 [Sphingopyxis sp.]|nr:hypothetical protein [Sphingopyxis sp.]